jgi:hypothetical protein
LLLVEDAGPEQPIVGPHGRAALGVKCGSVGGGERESVVVRNSPYRCRCF